MQMCNTCLVLMLVGIIKNTRILRALKLVRPQTLYFDTSISTEKRSVICDLSGSTQYFFDIMS